ncbi:MAG: hypothetical protein Q7S40_18040 [Opitutaceae bacterium]|nr:hypothetical protein [Opitutaceae bacterium]
MKIDGSDIHIVTGRVGDGCCEPSTLKIWMGTDLNAYLEKRKLRKSDEQWAILSAFDTQEEAIAEAERLNKSD